MLIPKTNFRVQAWAGQTLGSDAVDAKEMPSLLRRRITPFGRDALAIASSLPLLDKARYVFSSRHGEFSRTRSILESIAVGDPLSPADFSLSVHHALISLLSIVHKNHAGHTAVAGGADSFGAGLLESLSCLAEKPDEPVLLLYCDDLLPDEYAAFNEAGAQPVVFALLLSSTEGEDCSIAVMPSQEEVAHPSSIAHDFADFLSGEAKIMDSQTSSHLWRWERHGIA